MADTAKFEAASIASYYQAINNGVSAKPGVSPEMTDAMDKEYPSMSNDWREGILAGTEALMTYIGHSSLAKNKKKFLQERKILGTLQMSIL